MGTGETNIERLEKLIADVKPSGGSEMSNYQLFVERLTGALGLPQPEFAREETRLNDHVFERNVRFRHPNGTSSTGRIDCYKRTPDEPLAERVAHAEETAQVIREIARLEASLKHEKQFNRKVELNADLRAAQARHAALTG